MLNCFTVSVTTILRPEVSRGIKVESTVTGEPLSIRFGTEAHGNLIKIPVVEGGVVIEDSEGIKRIDKVSVRRSKISRNLLNVVAPRLGDVWDRALLAIYMLTPWKIGTPSLAGGADELLELTSQIQRKYSTGEDHVREGLFIIINRGSIMMAAATSKGLRYKFSYQGGKVVAQVLSPSAVEDDGEYELI